MPNPLLTKLEIQNFKCFRKKEVFHLTQGTYFIGVNNAGKTAILNAIRFFFDDVTYADESFLNKTEFTSRAKGYNRSQITLEFNIEALTTKKFKQGLIKKYDKSIQITKIITITERTKIVSASYKILGKIYEKAEIPSELRKLIDGVKITYLHPQEGKELLFNAQEKLRKRLLANWGRHPSLTQTLRKLQDDWDELRKKATSYLSSSLTESLQKIWRDSKATIELPKSIQDIISISDISFQGYKGAPEIQLTNQGTGAQSTILYLTHYLLDSDRSLHRGEYHPIWLLEEPESFLHSDLILKLAKELNSFTWLENIQMIVSTHSSMILASSHSGENNIHWNVLDNHSLKIGKSVTEWTEEQIKTIGDMMGDPNFYMYFVASGINKLIFIEDTKECTSAKYIEQGIKITRGLKGTSEVKKYIDVFKSTEEILNNNAYFIVDSDNGKKSLSAYFDSGLREKHIDGFTLYKVIDSNKIYLVFLPEGYAVEDLFSEFDSHLDDCASKLWDTTTWKFTRHIPTHLSRTSADIRSKRLPTNLNDAKLLIRNTQDVKDSFWEKIKTEGLKIKTEYISTIKKLTE